MLVSVPVPAFAQSTGSLGSAGNDVAPTVPVEHAPNPRELETIAMLNEVLDEKLDGFPGGEDLTIVIERDAELSRLAQLGAELTLPKFVAFSESEEGYESPTGYREFSPSILANYSPYLESFVCGPTPLSLDSIEEAYRLPFVGGAPLGGGLQYDTTGLLYFEKPVGGVGYAEGEGYACSYLLQQSANHPFR